MHEEPRQQLCQLIARYGRSLCDDSRRCRALLKDYCPTYKKEIFVLVHALDDGVCRTLLNTSAGAPLAIVLSRLSQQLQENLGLAEDAATWAVESWALALGVIERPRPLATPVQQRSAVRAAPSPFTLIALSPTAGGWLHFPHFSVGELRIGDQRHRATGSIQVPSGQAAVLEIAEDISDFSFLDHCDPSGVLRQLNLQLVKQFSAQALCHCRHLYALEVLDLSHHQNFSAVLSAEKQGLAVLAQLPHLTTLKLANCPFICRETLRIVSRLTQLEVLDLSMSQVLSSRMDDQVLPLLAQLTRLKSLDLSGCRKLTGPGVLSHFSQMTQLDFLNLAGCKAITHGRIQELKALLPATHILP